MAADLGGFTDGSAIRDLAASPCAACGRAIGGEAEEEAAEVVARKNAGMGRAMFPRCLIGTGW